MQTLSNILTELKTKQDTIIVLKDNPKLNIDEIERLMIRILELSFELSVLFIEQDKVVIAGISKN